jgi:hypothetical protein
MNWEYRAHRVCLEQIGRSKRVEWIWTMRMPDQSAPSLSSALALLGQQGWELAAVQLTGSNGNAHPDSIYVFKRPVADLA